MIVFSKVSKVVLPVVATGGILLLVATDKTKEEDSEYRQIDLKLLEESPSNMYKQGVLGIQQEAEKRHQEFLEKDRIRMEKIHAKIDAEVARIKEKDRQKELARQREIAEKKKQGELKKQQQNNNGGNKTVDTSNQSGWMTFTSTYYGTNCVGCGNKTSTGLNVANTQYYKGYKIMAADPRILPYGTLIEVTTPNGTLTGVIADTGGAMKGRYKLDILVGSEQEASKYGIHKSQVRIIGKIEITK